MAEAPGLQGNYRPARVEATAFDLPVEGAIPPELNGRLIRNGPNPISPSESPALWGVSDGMLHGIELRDGRAVSYRNRWVRTPRAAALLGEEPVDDGPDDVGTADINVVSHAGRLLAIMEACLPVRFTPELDTVGRFDFGGRLRSPMTAHPKIDPVTGEMLFFGYDLGGPPFLRFHATDAHGELVRSADIAIPGPAMMHDFAITEHHVVFMDLPVVADPGLVGRMPLPFSWDDGYGARVGVMSRRVGDDDVTWIDVEPCFVFHTMNAFEVGGRIVLDVVRYQEIFRATESGRPPERHLPTLDRWTIDVAGAKVLEERIDERAIEFPRVDERRVGRTNRFGYAVGLPGAAPGDDSRLYKFDLVAGSAAVLDLGAGHLPEEAVFAAGGSPDEDGGWLLSIVYDAQRDGSDLIVVDAADFEAGPVATVRLPQRVPFGLHGSWVPDPA